jgi:hypothetical protein
MSLNTYGTIRPATVTSSDVEIFLQYQLNVITEPEKLVKLNAEQIFVKNDNPDNVNEMLGGLYNIKLPASTFNKGIGLYYIYIRNKVLNNGSITIRDCAILEDANVKGLIFDLNELDGETKSLFSTENGLIGYRVEYLYENQNNGEKLIPNFSKIITGNYKVEPISTSINNNQNALGLRYKLNQNSSLVFVTLTPSGTSDINQNYNAFIGNPLQQVKIYNSFFTPMVLPIEITDIDLKSLSYGLYGDEVINCEKGIRTYFDDDGEIYKQFTEVTLRNELGEDVKKIRVEKDSIDFSEDI